VQREVHQQVQRGGQEHREVQAPRDPRPPLVEKVLRAVAAAGRRAGEEYDAQHGIERDESRQGEERGASPPPQGVQSRARPEDLARLANAPPLPPKQQQQSTPFPAQRFLELVGGGIGRPDGRKRDRKGAGSRKRRGARKREIKRY